MEKVTLRYIVKCICVTIYPTVQLLYANSSNNKVGEARHSMALVPKPSYLEG
jgi:hypothetical protein